MSRVQIWIHAVWATKYRMPLFTENRRPVVINHIRKAAYEKGIWIDSIGGCKDHLHVLIRLRKEQNVADVIKQIKGESSFWINQQNFFIDHFNWQREYFATSVSENDLDKIRSYIRNQAKHHKERI